jgi:dihydropteroate synthase
MTKIIGILNLTMDSFSDGGMYYDLASAKKHISEMIEQGADVIDIGAESTRSGFSDVDGQSQIKTLRPIVDFITDKYSIDISIDTRSSQVADAFSDKNISFINDVSSGTHDRNMLKVISELGCKYIMTHMPDEHQKGINKDYKNIIETLDTFFNERIKSCHDEGIEKEKIIIDPGIGFGKSGHDNITILQNIDSLLKIHDKICIGTSNKRFSSRLFNGIDTKDDLKVANVVSSTLCALKGTSYLRVHDVGLTKDTILITDKAKAHM